MNEEFEKDENWQELLKAFETGLINPVKELIREYRFYYDEDGNIIQTSDSNWNHPEAGNYVVVDEQTFNDRMKYRVRNGFAELKPTDPTTELQLKKSTSGYRVVKDNPAILVEENESIKNTEYYDRRTR